MGFDQSMARTLAERLGGFSSSSGWKNIRAEISYLVHSFFTHTATPERSGPGQCPTTTRYKWSEAPYYQEHFNRNLILSRNATGEADSSPINHED